jgi:hypothetical protein
MRDQRADLDAEHAHAVHYTAGFKISGFHRGKILGVASAIEETRESGDSTALVKMLTDGALDVMHLVSRVYVEPV